MSRSEHEMRQLDQEYGRVEDRRQERIMATKTAHTPGPWFAQPAGKNWWITTGRGLEETISCMAGTDPQGWPREANAHLIASAPEMLATLEQIYGFMEIWRGNARLQIEGDAANDVCVWAKAAIKKARGVK